MNGLITKPDQRLLLLLLYIGKGTMEKKPDELISYPILYSTQLIAINISTVFFLTVQLHINFCHFSDTVIH